MKRGAEDSDSSSSDDEAQATSFKRGKHPSRRHHQEREDDATDSAPIPRDPRRCSASENLPVPCKRLNAGPVIKAPEEQQRGSVVHNGKLGGETGQTENGKGEAAAAPDVSEVTFWSSSTEIMKQMGFRRGKGLAQFMNDYEVSASKVESIFNTLHEADIVVDQLVNFEEKISLDEVVQWIPQSSPEHACDFHFLSAMLKLGPKKTGIASETNFINPIILKDLLVFKKCLNVLTKTEYQYVRSRCNPFESIGNGPFVSRAGMKMANLDAILSFAITQPTTNSPDKHAAVGPNELFYFADVCAGPGAFSEYVLFRKTWGAKGFGMTLKGKLDFDIGSFYLGSPESFEPIYGPAGDGDVYNPTNVAAFIRHVNISTDNHGVHLMMADGGFEIEKKELQEVASAQIYLSQCLLALSVIRPGGMFVCKLFDSLTPFTVGLIYLMYLSFDLVGIHKPNTSRPANSERYLICKWKKPDTSSIYNYLSSCHVLYWSWNSQQKELDQDILELVSMDILKGNRQFFNYIVSSNDRIGRKQLLNLRKMVMLCRDPFLKDTREDHILSQCYALWKMSEDRSPISKKMIQLGGPDARFKVLVGSNSGDVFGRPEAQLVEQNMEMCIRSPYDWRIVVIEANAEDKNRGFYFSMGRNRIYYFNGGTWTHITQNLELCKDTIVYAEFVHEVQGTRPTQSVIKTFHIIDGLFLGGKDIRSLHYTQRHEVCVKFAKSMNKSSRPDLCAVRAKNPVRMENMVDIFDKLGNRAIPGYGAGAQLVCPVDHTDETLPFIRPAGILLLKITKDPWTMALSRSANRKYYFNINTAESSFSVPEESISDFTYTMQHRMVWWWDKALKTILSTQDVTDQSRTITTIPNVLNPRSILQYISNAITNNTNNKTGVMRRLSSTSSQGSS